MERGGQAVPLTEFQSSVARLLAPNRTEDSHLAGAAAVLLSPNSSRYSNDLDYFNDSEERVASAFEKDRGTLTSKGFSVEVILNQPGYIRAIVTGPDGGTKVEWAHDSAWRFLPAMKSEIAGYQLHPLDLAVNKVLALAGRDEPRDFLDVMDAHENILSLGALCWAAAGKDPGFTPSGLLDLLRRRGKYHPEDFSRLHLVEQPNLKDLKRRWLGAIAEAERFITSSPPDEAGCLYYSTRLRTFVDGEACGSEDVVPHHGRPGGVLPIPRD